MSRPCSSTCFCICAWLKRRMLHIQVPVCFKYRMHVSMPAAQSSSRVPIYSCAPVAKEMPVFLYTPSLQSHPLPTPTPTRNLTWTPNDLRSTVLKHSLMQRAVQRRGRMAYRSLTSTRPVRIESVILKHYRGQVSIIWCSWGVHGFGL